MTSVEEALVTLDAGGLVVIPTDTVYGLAARPDIPEALTKIFEVKSRPSENALPVLGAGAGDLELCVVFDERGTKLATAFWPGPLTLILPRAQGFEADLGGAASARTSVAVRVPAHELTLELLRRSGPLAVTSANRSGEAPATTIAEARAALSKHVDVFLDAGLLEGLPSTIVSLLDHELKVLREGALSPHRVTELLR